MKIEIDMSGKIEQTHLDTIIGLSNDIQVSVVLKKNVKRHLQAIFRHQGKANTFAYFIFAASTAILLSLVEIKSKVIIDKEYSYHEGLIKVWIISGLGKLRHTIPTIEFHSIGKSSNAHRLCSRVGSNKRMATKIIREEELIPLLPIKKSGTLVEGRRST